MASTQNKNMPGEYCLQQVAFKQESNYTSYKGKRLCNKNSKVSSHYLIGRDGKIINLVDEKKRAWHSGVSHWKGVDNLNDISIGIELENPGHEFGYIPFSKEQMDSLIYLCKELKSKYDIKEDWVLGHSDISPGRKLDPGDKFDWETIKKSFR